MHLPSRSPDNNGSASTNGVEPEQCHSRTTPNTNPNRPFRKNRLPLNNRPRHLQKKEFQLMTISSAESITNKIPRSPFAFVDSTSTDFSAHHKRYWSHQTSLKEIVTRQRKKKTLIANKVADHALLARRHENRLPEFVNVDPSP